MLVQCYSMQNQHARLRASAHGHAYQSGATTQRSHWLARLGQACHLAHQAPVRAQLNASLTATSPHLQRPERRSDHDPALLCVAHPHDPGKAAVAAFCKVVLCCAVMCCASVTAHHSTATCAVAGIHHVHVCRCHHCCCGLYASSPPTLNCPALLHYMVQLGSNVRMQVYYGAHMPTWRRAVDWTLIGVFTGLAIVATFGSGEQAGWSSSMH